MLLWWGVPFLQFLKPSQLMKGPGLACWMMTEWHVTQLSYYTSQLPDVLLTDCKYRSKSSPETKNAQAEPWAKQDGARFKPASCGLLCYEAKANPHKGQVYTFYHSLKGPQLVVIGSFFSCNLFISFYH